MEKLSNVITVFFVIAMVCTSDMVEGGRGAKKFTNEKVADQPQNIPPGSGGSTNNTSEPKFPVLINWNFPSQEKFLDPFPFLPFFPYILNDPLRLCFGYFLCFPLVPPLAKAKAHAQAPPVQPSAVTSSTVDTSSMGHPPSRTFPAVQMKHVVPPSPKTTSAEPDPDRADSIQPPPSRTTRAQAPAVQMPPVQN